MRIKLLIISDYIHTVVARPEAEIILQLQQFGTYDITVMTSGSAWYAKRFEEAGIRVVDFHISKKFSVEYVKFIRAELIQGQYDIVTAFNNMTMRNTIPALRGLKTKLVVYRGYTGNINWWDPFMYTKYLHPRVDRIICLVEAIRKIFRKNLLFNKDKAVTINKGHDIHWYDDIKPVGKVSLGLPENAFVFICGANVRRMKGIKYLLKATYYLPADANFHLVLAGKNMDKKEFIDLINNSPFRKNIHVIGYREDILEVVKSCDAFVLASIKGEAITKAVMEAMSMEVCPLITDIPGNEGLVEDKVCGLVVPPRNAKALAEGMVYLAQNPSVARQYAIAARQHIDKRFNTKVTAKKYDAMYRELYEELHGIKFTA